jgi:hypothetical protein
MSGPRVLLMRLSCRTSVKGTEYLSGFLGAARLVGFKSKEPDKYGNEQWEIYAQEPEPKTDSDQAPRRNAERGQSTWDRSRDARRDSTPEPLDDSAKAIRDLERGPER